LATVVTRSQRLTSVSAEAVELMTLRKGRTKSQVSSAITSLQLLQEELKSKFPKEAKFATQSKVPKAVQTATYVTTIQVINNKAPEHQRLALTKTLVETIDFAALVSYDSTSLSGEWVQDADTIVITNYLKLNKWPTQIWEYIIVFHPSKKVEKQTLKKSRSPKKKNATVTQMKIPQPKPETPKNQPPGVHHFQDRKRVLDAFGNKSKINFFKSIHWVSG